MNDHKNWEEKWKMRKQQQNPNSRLWLGAIFIIVGLAALAKATFFDLPYWLFTWPMILIVIGLFSGIKHNFRNNGWWIMMLIGGYFLTDHIFPGIINKQYFWPVAIIIVGVLMIIKPKRNCDDWSNWNNGQPKNSTDSATTDTASGTSTTQNSQASIEDFIDVAAVFGGVKKSVYSKNFKGGKISCVFGGGEINLLQADFTGTAVLEMNAVFGGCTLIIPSNWQLRINSTPFFGGIDDKRQQPSVISYDKTLVLNGSIVFGGVEIKSY